MSSALQLLTENAEAGSWQSQYALAELYQVGYLGISTDSTESNKWWQRLDAQKDPTIQLSVGRHFLARDPSDTESATKSGWAKICLTTKPTDSLSNGLAVQPHKLNPDAIWVLVQWETTGIAMRKS